MSDDKFEFRAGDKVKWGEEVGEVTAIKPDGSYPVFVAFTPVDFGGPFIFCSCFTKDGLYDKDLPKSPRLEFVDRPKKKIKKRYWQWKFKSLGSGYWYRLETYLDEEGRNTEDELAPFYGKEWMSLEKIKIEDDYVEIEVVE